MLEIAVCGAIIAAATACSRLAAPDQTLPDNAPDGFSVAAVPLPPPENQPEQQGNPGPYVLEIDGTTILKSEYDFLWDIYRFEATQQDDPPANLRQSFHNRLIEEQLLIHEAKRRGMDQQPEFIARRLRQENLLLLDLLKQNLETGIQVSDAEIESYYATHQETFTLPAQVQVRHILTDNREKAEEILEMLQEGDDFANLAREHSIHPTAGSGGALPPFTRGTYSEQFEATAFALQVGEVSNIVQTDLGFHIIEKTANQPSRLRPLSEMKEEIRQTLHKEKFSLLLDQLLSTLRQQVEIKTHFPESQ